MNVFLLSYFLQKLDDLEELREKCHNEANVPFLRGTVWTGVLQMRAVSSTPCSCKPILLHLSIYLTC